MAMLNNQMVPKLAKLAYSLFDRCFAHGEKKMHRANLAASTAFSSVVRPKRWIVLAPFSTFLGGS